MSLELAQKVVDDCGKRHLISDGVFTFARLHSDRLSLLINLFDLLSKLYQDKGLNKIYWLSTKDHNGNETKDHIHLGLFHDDPKLLIGALVPDKLFKLYEGKSHLLDKAPNYKTLAQTLPNYFYGEL